MWACDKGDKVRHFYVFTDAECAPICYPVVSILRILTDGKGKKKCTACLKALGES